MMDEAITARLWEELFSEAQDNLRQGQLEPAVENFQAAVNVCENFEQTDPRRPRSLMGLGLAYSIKRDFARAEPLFEQSLALTRKNYGRNHPECVTLLKHLALTATSLKKFDKARDCYDEAIALQEDAEASPQDIAKLKEQRENLVKMASKLGTAGGAAPAQSPTAAPKGAPVQKGNAAGQVAQTPVNVAPANAAPKVPPIPPPVLPKVSASIIDLDDVDDQREDRTVLVKPSGPTPVSGDMLNPRTSGSRFGSMENTGLHGMILDNKYKITGQIGEGGMSTVWRARHVLLDRDVAIKVLQKRFLGNTKDRERFKQEARLLSKLKHPGIVSIYDFGETESFNYLVMDYIEGQSLSVRLKQQGRLPEKDVLRVAMELCDALQHAHNKGILHRDLKPSNVMLLTNDEGIETPLLVDFGIAKLLSGADDVELTQTGETIGSPLYMSPEQCRSEQIDHRADIYALGCLLYQSLAGRTPFTGTGAIDLYIKHATMMPDRISIVSPEVQINPALEEIVMRSLAKQPQYRYQSMDQLRDALRQVSK